MTFLPQSKSYDIGRGGWEMSISCVHILPTKHFLYQDGVGVGMPNTRDLGGGQ